MTLDVQRLVLWYSRGLAWSGLLLAGVVLALDPRWTAQPWAGLVLFLAIGSLRIVPIRLSKYSYLTQTGIPALAGVLTVGAAPVVLALVLGTVAADVGVLRKSLRAGLVNAGREVLALCSAAGAYGLVLRVADAHALTLDALPALFTLVATYFVASRALFYFTLSVRAKLEPLERLLVLRWEVVSYILTLVATGVVVAALHLLSPLGWVPVLLLLGVFGLLTRRIMEEAIAAEDLTKIHTMETVVASSQNLQTSFEELERVGYRLLDWTDFRIYRVTDGRQSLVYQGRMGGGPQRPAGDGEPLRRQALRENRPVVVKRASSDPRLDTVPSGLESLVVHPVRFGDDLLGTVELAHPKRHMYGGRDVAALGGLCAQIATAIHIAELRRPLVATVGKIGDQAGTLSRATEALRGSSLALASVSRAMSRNVAEQEAFVQSGFEAIASLALATNEMAAQGRLAADASRRAADVAADNHRVIADAIRRLVAVQGFVDESARGVTALGEATRRITGLIGIIREIADLTSLIALNAAIEAARAGQEGRGFAIVADEVRQLAAQTMEAAREVGGLVGGIVTQVEQVTGQMQRGRDVVAGVDALSAEAGSALERIVGATGEAGAHARRIAETAEAQESALEGLTARIGEVAAASARTRSEADTLTEQASAAEEGQREVERATRELGALAADLQAIARHFEAV